MVENVNTIHSDIQYAIGVAITVGLPTLLLRHLDLVSGVTSPLTQILSI